MAKLKKKKVKILKPKKAFLKDTDAATHEEPIEGTIFTSSMHPFVHIGLFKSKFMTTGISLLDAGKNSLISQSMYNQIKMQIKQSRVTSNV